MKLLEDEKLLFTLNPKRSLVGYWLFCDFLRSIGLVLIAGIWVTVVFFSLKQLHTILITILGIALGIFALYMVIRFITNSLRFNKLKVWITTKRVIIRKGLVGYSEKSLLLERIGEIIVKETFLQRLFGIRILMLEVLGTGRRREVLPGFPSAVETKQTLLDLISKKRKAEKLTY